MSQSLIVDDVQIAAPVQVRKRDGQTLQMFDFQKITNAVSKAWLEAEGTVDKHKLRQTVLLVLNTLSDDVVDVEAIQDRVEVALMRVNPKVAKAYIIYRQKRTVARQARRKPDPTAISDYTHFAKYARWREDWLRREVYTETVDRVEAMHLKRFGHIKGMADDIRWAFDRVREKRVLPSMRSMQFGGRAVEVNNNRLYNCSFSFVDRPRVFAEAMFLLLCGCGVGYSVQFEHVDKLPPLRHIDTKNVVHHVVDDTIEGWANALDALIRSYLEGHYLEFSFHKIRNAGAPLKTSGGKAPGHLRLKEALEQVRKILHGAQGRQLRPIECHDILCLAADAVLSGGIRRSAMISIFSLEDSEMMYAKTGDWYSRAPWRENANNSCALKRNEVKKKQFKRIFQMTKEWGEPGFLFVDDLDYGTNPCAEIGLNPKLVITDEVLAMLRKRQAAFRTPFELPKKGDVYTGWAFCNLCEQNAAKFTSYEDFLIAAKAATIIGTLQASYTEMPYLGWVSETIAEREALIGIGMTGMLDAPHIACNPQYQRDIAQLVIEWNKHYAERIGIRPAARTTCVKPSGTTSLELGCVASGHHAHHARRYIRRVIADEYETVFQAFREKNPHACIRKPNGKWVVEFPVEAPESAMLKENLSALEFLDMVKSTQQNWVVPGIARPESSPGLSHNVSNTVHVRPEEWDEVAEYLWEHRGLFTGVSFVPVESDKKYAFAPNEAVATEADEARWNQLVANYKPIDYTLVLEAEDGTMLTGEAACAGGACENPMFTK